MARIAAKSLLCLALVAGLCVATVGALNAGTGDLPPAPDATGPQAATGATGTTGDRIVDMKNWQQTRLPKGSTSNKIP